MGPLEECRSTQSPEVVPVSDPFPPAKARMRAELFPNPVALSFILSIHHFLPTLVLMCYILKIYVAH